MISDCGNRKLERCRRRSVLFLLVVSATPTHRRPVRSRLAETAGGGSASLRTMIKIGAVGALFGNALGDRVPPRGSTKGYQRSACLNDSVPFLHLTDAHKAWLIRFKN